MEKKVLIISYSFPPMPGIGGRRWAKFAKHLSKEGYTIYVLGTNKEDLTNSLWVNDVKTEGINYYSVKNPFLSFFHKAPKAYREKIRYKITLNYLKIKIRGNYFDRSCGCINNYYSKAKDLIIKYQIKNLIITIAPNQLVEVGIRLKKDFPELNFIYDVRDPWNIYNDNWDHKLLSARRKKNELLLELNAAQIANKVISVTDAVTHYYKEKFPLETDKFITIPNGYDADEIFLDLDNNTNLKKKEIVFTGTLYDNVAFLFEEFLKSINELKKENKIQISNFEFTFYSPKLNLFDELLQKHEISNVSFKEQVPVREINIIINNSLACMLFLPPKYEFALSTKFFEYVARNKKILLFSQEGEVTKLFETYNLGFVLKPYNIKESLKTALMTILTQQEDTTKKTFPIENYSIRQLTETIKKLLV